MKRFNHRVIILSAIVLGSAACTFFVFPYSPLRVWESMQDVALSAKYYFEVLIYGFSDTVVTVTEYSKYPFRLPFNLPTDFEEFKALWSAYWQKVFNLETLQGYFSAVGNGLYNFSRILVFSMPFIIAVFVIAARSKQKTNNDYGKESKPLKLYKKLAKNVFSPVGRYVKSVFTYMRERKWFKLLFVTVWLLNFNVISIVLEFLAFYLYFVMSFDFAHIYRQFFKLLADLSAALWFIPLPLWIVGVFAVLAVVARKRAYAILRHYEMRNRGFLNERGVVTIVQGVPGAGKTAFCVDIALSAEVQFRDQAFEKLIECDLKFPFFPWQTLENDFKALVEKRKIFDLTSARKWIRKKQKQFETKPCRENIFGYDFEYYPYYADNKLKVEDIWTVAENYLCFYFIYTVRSSLILANISIRSDNALMDEGNLPLWNTDFFARTAEEREAYSRHSHILDFDMLRLGKVLLENNPNRNAFGFGVYVISEIDKERKSMPTLQEVKRSAEECNQKNDMFSELWKMSRHACVVDNEVFVKMFSDLQRPGNLGADVRELGEVLNIDKFSDFVPVLPIYSPFYLFDTLHAVVFGKFFSYYTDFRFRRGDNTLGCYIFKRIAAFLHRYKNGVYNTFGCSVLSISLQHGTMDGEVISRKWYKMPFKVYSERYSTDCLSGIFEKRAANNSVGLDKMPEYENIKATWDELSKQHSFFQEDIKKYAETEKKPRKTKKQQDKKRTSFDCDVEVFGLKSGNADKPKGKNNF